LVLRPKKWLKAKTCSRNLKIKYSFTSRVVDIWNRLPEEIIVAKTVKEFEIGLDNHWEHQECKYDFSMDINIRSKTGCHVKSCTEVEIVAE
jgi:hypothetical protein